MAVRILLVLAMAALPAAAEDIRADQATHKEVEPLPVAFKHLTTLCLHTSGKLLAAEAAERVIKVIDQAGKVVGELKPGFGPEAMDVARDGAIYCGGEGQLAKLTIGGKVVKKTRMPLPGADQSRRRRGRFRPPHLSGMAVTDRDLFVAVGAGWSLGSRSRLYRFDLDLANPKVIATDLRCCCQRCDITARDGTVYLAENTLHRVVRYDREGRVVGRWGERSRTGLAGFGSCCNPMNLCFGPNAELYTAESGLGRVKRYTPDGKCLGLVGYIGVTRFNRAGALAASCSNIAIAVTPDGRRVYVMDYKKKLIRVLEKKD